MCTLTLAWRLFDPPVAVAANRDEAHDRPSDPPTVRGDQRRFLAPRDAEAGGTWIGLTETGLVAAVTNRWLDADRSGDRSRGLLVEDCLRRPSAAAAVRTVEREVDRRSYDGFSLVLADDDAAVLLSYDGTLTITRLDPGVHVVGNVGGVINGADRFVVPARRGSDGAERADSARRVANAVSPGTDESAVEWLDRANDVLADHAYGACLHGDGFGTRSFTRIVTGPAPAMAFADGPPCETPAEPTPVPPAFGSDRSGSGDATESQF